MKNLKFSLKFSSVKGLIKRCNAACNTAGNAERYSVGWRKSCAKRMIPLFLSSAYHNANSEVSCYHKISHSSELFRNCYNVAPGIPAWTPLRITVSILQSKNPQVVIVVGLPTFSSSMNFY